MKEQVTKFDLESAFKALDEIEIPKTGKIRPEKRIFDEEFSKEDKFKALFEDYYDINNQDDLVQAQEDREADVAKAKLARIERIVDLDAQSEEELLPSYVGKYIMQCPQCMTLFYKAPEELEHSEEDDNIVNVGEKCQHCGNETGYTLIGKVGEVPVEEMSNYEETSEEPVEEVPEEAPEEVPEEPAEGEPAEEEPEVDLGLSDEGEESDEEEKKEESFNISGGELLNEEVDAELNKKLEEHNEYIKYLQDQIDKEEKALESEKNEFVRNSIEECIEALKAKLEEAIPDEVKTSDIAEEETAEDVEEESIEDASEVEDIPEDEAPAEVPEENEEEVKESLTENKKLNEDELPEFTEANIDKMLDSPEFQTDVTEAEVEQCFEGVGVDIEHLADVDDKSINEAINGYLREVYSNVKESKITDCEISGKTLTLESLVTFNSGKTKTVTFNFKQINRNIFEGVNKTFAPGKAFALECSTKCNGTTLVAESLKYRYKINNNLVEGLVKTSK